MTLPPLPPLRFTPLLKARPWGGRRLGAWGKSLPPKTPVGESWEISDRPGDQSLVAEGPLQGRALGGLAREYGPALLGTAVKPPFPLLVKLLDAREWLSIQLHPGPGSPDGGEPKTEAWYILKASDGAEILLGLGPGGRVPEDLLRHRVRPGDGVLVPAGMPHAIGPGILLAEVSQNSDTTYRMHDWGRGRALHPEQVQQNLLPGAGAAPTPLTELHCGPFTLSRRTLAGEQRLATTPERFRLLGIAQGQCALAWDGGRARIARGTWWLLPASLGAFSLDGDAVLLEAAP